MPSSTLIDEETLTRELETYEGGAAALDRHLDEICAFPRRLRVDRETLVRILQAIGPTSDRTRECIREVLGRIIIMTLMLSSDDTPAPGEMRSQLLGAASGLKRARIMVEGLLRSHAASILTMSYEVESGEIKPGLEREDFENFLTLAKRIENAAVTCGEGLAVPPGKPRQNEAKMSAAAFAFNLLTDFQKRPTLTIDGAYFNLASLLYEAVSGESLVSLEHACREYWKVRDAE